MKKIQALLTLAFTVILVQACWMTNKEEIVNIKLGEVEEGPRIIVGTLGTGEPYSAITADNIWSGFEADVWAEIEKRSGMVVELRTAKDTEEVFENLRNEEIDVAANCFSITQSRLEEFIASGPLYADVYAVVVQTDSVYQTLQEFRRCTIGVSKGQIREKVLGTLAEEFGWNLKEYNEIDEGIQEYLDKKIDAYAGRLIEIRELQGTVGTEFRVIGEPLYGNHVGWLFSDTTEGTELRDELNVYIADMQKDGTLSRIAEKWFGEDMTKYISNKWFIGAR